MLKAILAAQKSSDAVILDGEILTRDIHFVYEGSNLSSFYIVYTCKGTNVKIEFTAEMLEKARFNDVTTAFEFFDKDGRFTTLNFQRMTPVLETNMRLRELVTKQQYARLSEEELDELEIFLEDDSDY